MPIATSKTVKKLSAADVRPGEEKSLPTSGGLEEHFAAGPLVFPVHN